MVLFKLIEIEGSTVKVEIDDTGWFVAQAHGGTLTAPTLDGLKDKLGKALKRRAIRLDMPVVFVEYGGPVRGTLKSLKTNGRVSIKTVAGDATNIYEQSPWNINALRALSDEEFAELAELVTAKNEACAAVEKFVHPRRLKVEKIVMDAQAREWGSND